MKKLLSFLFTAIFFIILLGIFLFGAGGIYYCLKTGFDQKILLLSLICFLFTILSLRLFFRNRSPRSSAEKPIRRTRKAKGLKAEPVSFDDEEPEVREAREMLAAQNVQQPPAPQPAVPKQRKEPRHFRLGIAFLSMTSAILIAILLVIFFYGGIRG